MWLDQGIIEKIQQRFWSLLGSYYAPELNKTRGKRHLLKQWQAKQTVLGAQKNNHQSILERFRTDTWYRICQAEKLGWTEADCRYLDCIATVDISHNASQVQRQRYEKTMHMKCGDPNRQLGPMRQRDDYHKATRALICISKQEGKVGRCKSKRKQSSVV